MYKVIGADGKEYGPITNDQLQQWIADGRVNSQTRVRAVDDAEWKTAGDLAELAPVFWPNQPPGGPSAPATRPKTSGLAITSLVMGILGLFTCGVTAIVGLILGLVAMSKIRKSEGRLSGSGLALSGTIVSAIFILMFPIFMAMLLPALARAKDRAQEINCMNNLRQISMASRTYAMENNGQLPGENWSDAILVNVGSEKLFRCPKAPEHRCSYVFNANLAGRKYEEVNPATVLFFEAGDGWNQTGSFQQITPATRHRFCLVVLADGSMETISPEEFSSLRWEP